MSQGSSTHDLWLLGFQLEGESRSEQWHGFGKTIKLENTIPKAEQVKILLFKQEKNKT